VGGFQILSEFPRSNKRLRTLCGFEPCEGYMIGDPRECSNSFDRNPRRRILQIDRELEIARYRLRHLVRSTQPRKFRR
jgi:hypothetical protein